MKIIRTVNDVHLITFFGVIVLVHEFHIHSYFAKDLPKATILHNIFFLHYGVEEVTYFRKLPLFQTKSPVWLFHIFKVTVMLKKPMFRNKSCLLSWDMIHWLRPNKETGLSIWDILKRNTGLLIFWDRGSTNKLHLNFVHTASWFTLVSLY